MQCLQPSATSIRPKGGPGIDGQGLFVMHLTGSGQEGVTHEAVPMALESTIGSMLEGCILVWALVWTLIGGGWDFWPACQEKVLLAFRNNNRVSNSKPARGLTWSVKPLGVPNYSGV